MKEINTEIGIRNLFAMNLKRFRNDLKMSQLELAAVTGISHNFINNIENERKWPSVKTIAKLVRALNVEPYHFFMPEAKWNIDGADFFKKELSDSIALVVKEQCDRYIKSEP